MNENLNKPLRESTVSGSAKNKELVQELYKEMLESNATNGWVLPRLDIIEKFPGHFMIKFKDFGGIKESERVRIYNIRKWSDEIVVHCCVEVEMADR